MLAGARGRPFASPAPARAEPMPCASGKLDGSFGHLPLRPIHDDDVALLEYAGRNDDDFPGEAIRSVV